MLWCSMSASAVDSGQVWRGEVVHLFAFDIAYELRRPLPSTLLGVPLAEYSMDASRRSPRHLLFYKPLLLRLPTRERVGPGGPLQVHLSVKLLAIGAISVAASIPFEVDSIESLTGLHEPRFTSGTLEEEVTRLAEEIALELSVAAVRPVTRLLESESYTVFCLRPPAGEAIPARAWLEQHRRSVAGLLTQEPGQWLADEEVVESTARSLSYYTDDLCVVDWDAALILDDATDTAAALSILEIANLQLAELKAYDRHLVPFSSAATATSAPAGRPVGAAKSCAKCASSRSTSPGSTTSWPTRQSSLATGTWPGFSASSPPGFTSPSGMPPSTASCTPWASCTRS